VLTFRTDQPDYPPWYIGDNPANGEGFESALAYAVAANLGFAAGDVRWVRVPFSEAITAGPKTFDANLSQFSITEQRRAAVDFSSPYVDVSQAVVAVTSSPASGVRNINDLKAIRLGAQVGSTRCVSSTVDALRADGTLARLQTVWLADAGMTHGAKASPRGRAPESRRTASPGPMLRGRRPQAARPPDQVRRVRRARAGTAPASHAGRCLIGGRGFVGGRLGRASGQQRDRGECRSEKAAPH
jgi:Bacterial extracellular solute-binding proteins, family 3